MSRNQIIDALTREGVLYNVTVRYWRAARKLKPEDLGLADGRVNSRLISLGHKRLLPKEALAPFALIESRVHAAVQRASFPFLGGIARFVPNANLEALTTELALLQHEFDEETGTFLARYTELREESMAEWRDAARALGVEVEEFVARIGALFPSGHDIRDRFRFASHAYQITVPESAGLNEIEAGDQMAVARARAEVARTAAERLAAGTREFVADCVQTLRNGTAVICDEMIESMRSGKTDGVHQRTLNRLVRFIDEFERLNFAGDLELEELLEETRRTLLSRTAEEYRDDDSARRALQSGITRLADEARALMQDDPREIVERFGRLGVRRFALEAA